MRSPPVLTLAFVHTAAVHVETFDRLLGDRGAGARPVRAVHDVRPEWLERARERGLDAALRDEVDAGLRRAAAFADAVLLTCSTLGPVADAVAGDDPRVLRIDRPLAERAARTEGVALVAYALASTVDSTVALLRQAHGAAGRGEDFELVACERAWPRFEAGDREGFGRTIASRVLARLDADPTAGGTWGCVMLAQASMAAAAPLLAPAGLPVLTSPPLALEATLAAAGLAPPP